MRSASICARPIFCGYELDDPLPDRRRRLVRQSSRVLCGVAFCGLLSSEQIDTGASQTAEYSLELRSAISNGHSAIGRRAGRWQPDLGRRRHTLSKGCRHKISRRVRGRRAGNDKHSFALDTRKRRCRLDTNSRHARSEARNRHGRNGGQRPVRIGGFVILPPYTLRDGYRLRRQGEGWSGNSASWSYLGRFVKPASPQSAAGYTCWAVPILCRRQREAGFLTDASGTDMRWVSTC